MNVFQAVKQAVTTRQATESYGLEVGHNGMTCCPFHSDRNPSMKVDDRFHCFGCGEDGDVIDFTAKLFGVGLKEAAQRLASDFEVCYDNVSVPPKPSINRKLKAVQEKQAEQQCFNTLCDYCHLLRTARTELAPKSHDEPFHPLFVESLQHLDEYEYYCDIFISGSKEERAEYLNSRKDLLNSLKQKLNTRNRPETDISIA